MKYILGLILLVIYVAGMAQRPYYRPQVHELSLQLGAVHWLPKFPSLLTNQTPWGASPLNGLVYTHHFNRKTALRLGGFYQNQSARIHVQGEGFSSPIKFKLFSIEVKAGAVRSFDIRKSRIYIGANGIFSSTNIKEEASNLPITTTSQDYIGLGGLIGYRRFFNPNFSLSLEAEPHGLQSISKSLLPNPYKTKSSINLQVLVSYHFKELRKSCACGKPGS